jgi:transposase
MALGKRTSKQPGMWIAANSLPRAASHPFYDALNQLLRRHGFDQFVEDRCARFYAPTMGRPSIPPGVYFRMLFIGYFEGIDSERGIAWRVADSLVLREFLGLELSETTPNHSSLSRTRHRIDVETHSEVFTWVLTVLGKEGLLKGKTIGVDATTLEANAALRSIVRRDTGERYEEFLTGLAQASGIETPTRQDLAKLDRKRKNKGSNDDWEHPHDPDARITKMKDGRTHLAHKAEHAVDMDTHAIVAVTLPGADEGDTETLPWTLIEAEQNLETVEKDQEAKKSLSDRRLAEVVMDKGYHSNETMVYLKQTGSRSYVSEPDRGRRRWKGKREEQSAVYANRRRIRGERGKRLLRKRGELLERPFAHLYETGGMRRTHLRHRSNILKRLLLHTSAANLGLVMRKLVGRGTPRGFQGLQTLVSVSLRALLPALMRVLESVARQLTGSFEEKHILQVQAT